MDYTDPWTTWNLSTFERVGSNNFNPMVAHSIPALQCVAQRKHQRAGNGPGNEAKQSKHRINRVIPLAR